MAAFTWENFDNSFLKKIIYSPETPENVRPIFPTEEKEDLVCSMNLICDYPDKSFVVRYRDVIEENLFHNYSDIFKEVCSTVGINMYDSINALYTLRLKPLTVSLISAYINALLKTGGCDVMITQSSKFRYTIKLDMAKTPSEDIPLYDYQKDAVSALTEHFVKKDNKKGMLIMPTGSGKSRTASYFLIREMISLGYQVLWIVHRHMLIDQAAECFYRFAGLSKLSDPDIKNYRISCISGEHQSIRAIAKKDNIIIGSIQSLCRNHNHLRRITSPKLFIVIDEAHHTFARSYRETLKYLFKYRPDAKLLGITATPVRSSEGASAELLKLFDNNIIYDISLGKLIANGILADPVFKRVETNEELEPMISEDEAKNIRRFGELPESLIGKIAQCAGRNKVILEDYLKNADAYGKTLIFALNVLHCRLLMDELKKHRVRCSCVYSGKDDNSVTIEKFKQGLFDVLINVNIMTEGSDVPDIDTVFLTRPTQSEGLLMQMIGRGMRGRKAGGTEKVNIVDFNDKWEVFNKWLNPEWIIEGEYEEREENKGEKKPYIYYSWELCKEVYKAFEVENSSYNTSTAVPSGWYTLADENGDDYILLVFADQLTGYKNLISDRKAICSEENINIPELIRKYFPDFCLRPDEYSISLFIENLRIFETIPYLNCITDRKKVDPYHVAEALKESGGDFESYAYKIYDRYPIAQELYGTRENYAMKVAEAQVYKGKKIRYGEKIEELPDEKIPFSREPYHDLDTLVQEVKDEMFGGEYEGISSIEWTSKAYKTYYGCYFYRDNRIVINSILNSKDVPREVVKYVIYHELLHRDYHRHDKAFREQEHKFRNYEEWEYFLDGHMNDFEIEEYM